MALRGGGGDLSKQIKEGVIRDSPEILQDFSSNFPGIQDFLKNFLEIVWRIFSRKSWGVPGEFLVVSWRNPEEFLEISWRILDDPATFCMV